MTHEFTPGDEAKVATDGRRYVLCAVPGCGLTKRAKPHQPEKKPRPAPVIVAPEPEPRELTMVRLAVDAALERPDLGWTLRQRLVAVRQAVDLPPDEKPEPVAAVGAPATRTTRPSRRADARWVRKAIRGPMWGIAEAAIDQGYEAQRMGNGHVRFTKGIQAFSLSTTVRDSEAHSLANARAAARRAGVVI